ncbi:uncharacterized protein [Arachis hypogaea]|uniref:uncharacterized protein n=1 Tax=Arachis hypogaea TaxID=3818 RepID=UPI003B2279BA
MSTRTADRLWISGVTLTKGLHTREEEEDRVSSQLLLKVCYSESVVTEECEKQFNEEQELEQLCQIGFKIYPFSSEIPAERKIILPGSFNLLHEGHLKLMEVASCICGDGYPCFELFDKRRWRRQKKRIESKRRVVNIVEMVL